MAYAETARKRARTAAGIFPAVLAGTVTITVPTIATLIFNTDTVNVPGARVGDLVFISPKNLAQGLLIASAEITAPSTMTLKIWNPTGLSITGAPGQFTYIILRG